MLKDLFESHMRRLIRTLQQGRQNRGTEVDRLRVGDMSYTSWQPDDKVMISLIQRVHPTGVPRTRVPCDKLTSKGESQTKPG